MWGAVQTSLLKGTQNTVKYKMLCLNQNTDWINGSQVIWYSFRNVFSCNWSVSHLWQTTQWSRIQHFITPAGSTEHTILYTTLNLKHIKMFQITIADLNEKYVFPHPLFVQWITVETIWKIWRWPSWRYSKHTQITIQATGQFLILIFSFCGLHCMYPH